MSATEQRRGTGALGWRVAELSKSFPLVSDRALIDLVNGIQVSGEIVRFQRQRNLLGRLLDIVDGDASARQLVVQENVLAGQESLLGLSRELVGALGVTQATLTLVQESLLETRQVVRGHTGRLEAVEAGLAQVSRALDERLDLLRDELRYLHLQAKSDNEVERILAAWESGRTYADVHWAVQAALLSREIFSGLAGVYEVMSGDTRRYRQLLADRFVAGASADASWFSHADLLDSLPRSTLPALMQMSADLLDIRATSWSRVSACPHLFTLGTALELHTLPSESQPPHVGACTLALTRMRVGELPRVTDARKLVDALVRETADDCRGILSRWGRDGQ